MDFGQPVSTSASEISPQAGEGDFDDESLVGTPKQPEVQVLVVQSQNEANMATSSTLTAAGTTMTAQSTAELFGLFVTECIKSMIVRIEQNKTKAC